MDKNVLTLGVLGVVGYLVYQWWQTQQATAAATTPAATPGTSALMSGQQQISVITPTGSGEPTAVQLQNQLNKISAYAADWNNAYTALTGRSIDQLYGFNFNAVYGGLGSTITAQAFLNMAHATGFSPHINLSGLGRVYTFRHV